MIDDVDDAEVIRQCLWAVINGPFFPDWRFHALFGFDRDEVRRIAEAWPNWGDDDEQRDAINNTLNNLISGPHDCWDVWRDYIPATGPELCGCLCTISRRAVGSFNQRLLRAHELKLANALPAERGSHARKPDRLRA